MGKQKWDGHTDVRHDADCCKSVNDGTLPISEEENRGGVRLHIYHDSDKLDTKRWIP